MTVQCTCNKNKHKGYTVFIFFKSIQLIISPQWLWTSRLVDIFFEKLADRIKKKRRGFYMMFPLIWNNQILLYVPCFWYNLEEITISILRKKLLFMNVFRTNTKKNHEAYPHASTNKWQVGQTRGPVITGLRSISVTCAKLVLCLWNKNKILLFYGKFLYFPELAEPRKEIQGSIKINSCVQKTCPFLVYRFRHEFHQ